MYWVGGSGNWNNAENWSLSPQGTGGAGIPDQDNNVVIGQTIAEEINITESAFCAGLLVENLSALLVFSATEQASFNSFGSVVLHDSLAIIIPHWNLMGNSPHLNANDADISSEIIVNVDHAFNLDNHLVLDGNGTLNLLSGSFNSNGFSIACDIFKSSPQFGTIDLNSSLFYVSEGISLNAQTPILQEHTKTLLYPQQMAFLEPGNLQFESQQLPTCGNGPGQTPFTIDAIVLSNYNGEDISCNGADDGVATVTVSGGIGPFIYQWIGGDLPGFTQNYSNLGAGTYTVLVTDLGQGITCVDNVQFAEPAPITIFSLILTPPSCEGNCNGTATPIAIGGVPNYEYNWSNGETGFMATQLCEGSNTLILADSNGCTFDSTFTLEREILNFNLSVINVLCAGGITGSATANPDGGAGGPYTIEWSNGDSGVLADGLTAGDYTLSITDGLNCTSDTTFTVTEEPPIIINEDEIIDESCVGEMNGAISISVSGGSLNYTFEWSGPNGFSSVSEDINGLGEGDYSITVTDANNCENTITFAVDAPPSISITGLITPVACAGESTGAINLTISGGTPGFLVAWSGPNGFASNVQDITGLSAGDYTIIVTDNASCEESESFTITESPELVLDQTITEVSCYNGADGAISITVSGGTPTFSFEWSGPNGFNAITEDIAGLEFGDYSLTITDSNNCETDYIFPLSNPDPFDVQSVVTAVSCFGNDNGTIDLSVSGGSPNYTYGWTGPNGFGSTLEDINSLEPGNYSVTITDANGCEESQDFIIAEPTEILANPVITNISCGGLTDGAIDLNASGGTPGYSYDWSGPDGFSSVNEEITGLDNGSYNLTITDSNSCTEDFTFDITEDPPLELNAIITDVDCNGANNGEIDLSITGGIPNYDIAWLGDAGFTASTEDISNLAPGDYSVTVTDANSCIISQTFSISEPVEIEIIVDLTPITCPGEADATIDITINGGNFPYDFDWSGPGGFTVNTEDIGPIGPGTYTLELSDNLGCIQTAEVIISEPSPIIVIPVISNISCGGLADGSIEISILGGSPNYTQLWAGPGGFSSTEEDIFNLAPGSYDLMVTDFAGCSESFTYDITEEPPLEAETVLIDISCSGELDGSINLQISGGNSPFDIVWTGPAGFNAATEDISGLDAGDYNYTITDFNNCVLSGTVTIVEPLPIDVEVQTENPSCNGANDGSITLTISGGQSPYDVQWGGGLSGESITDLEPGTYTPIITDFAGCVLNIAPITITEAPPIDVVFDVLNPECAGQPIGEILANISGGEPDYVLLWSGPNGFSASNELITGLETGTYEIEITDAAGCVLNDQIDLTSPELIDLQFDISTIVCAEDLGDILLSVIGGTPPYAYSWTGPGGFSFPGEDLIGVSAGDYTVIVTDDNACIGQGTATLSAPNPLAISALVTPLDCSGNDNGSINLSIAGGTPVYTIMWSGPGGFVAGTEDISSLAQGDYFVEIEDANGCQTDSTFTVSQPPLIEITSVVTNPLCAQQNTGAVDITVSGGFAPYTFTWTGDGGFGSPAEDISNVNTGNYFLHIDDSGSCVFDTTFTLTETPGIFVDALLTNIICGGTLNGAIDITASGGSGSYEFLWDGPQGFVSTQEDLIDLNAGQYDLEITDSNGCSIDTSFTLTEAQLLEASFVAINPACGLLNGSIEAVTTGGTPGYSTEWFDISTGIPIFISDQLVIDNLGSGFYQFELTDAQGCFFSEIVPITDEPGSVEFNATGLLCFGDSNGTIDITISNGTPPYLIEWSGPDGFNSNQEDISDLQGGDYILSVTDDNNCVINDIITVDEPLALVLDPETVDVFCNGSNSGEVLLEVFGGTEPYVYAWSGPGGFESDESDINGLAPGSYTLTLTDANLCVADTTVAIVESVLLDISLSFTAFICNGSADGTVDLTVNGGTAPYIFEWSNEGNIISSNEDLINLTPGDYSLHIEDALGCFRDSMIIITEASLVNINVLATQPLCGVSNGSFLAEVTGGIVIGDYIYEWYDLSSGTPELIGNNALIENLPAGIYQLIAYDDLGCSAGELSNLSDIGAELEALITNVLCFGDTNGTIDLSVNGAADPYTIVWGGPNGYTSAAEDISDLFAGDYSVIVEDNNGCTFTDLFEVESPEQILINLVIGEIFCFGDSNGSISAQITGGTIDYDINWFGTGGFSANGPDIANLQEGCYDLVIQDANACVADSTICLIAPAALDLTASITDVICGGQAQGIIDLTINGGSPGFVVEWVGPDGFIAGIEDIGNLFDGAYDVQVVDANNCQTTGTFFVNENPALSTDPIITNPLCTGESNGSIQLQVTGGAEPLTIEWFGPNAFSSFGADISNLLPGIYTWLMFDANGCQASDEITLSDPEPLALDSLVIHLSCFDSNDGSIELLISGGTPIYSVFWTGPNGFSSTAEDIFNLQPGTYQYQAGDANACVISGQIQVDEPPLLVIDLDNTLNPSCSDSFDGLIDISVSGGQPNYTITWTDEDGNTISNLEDLIDLGPGLYNVEVIDSGNCVQTITDIELIALDVVTALTTADFQACFGTGPFLLEGEATGEETLSWSDEIGLVLSDSSSVWVNPPPGEYYFVFEAIDGPCSASDTVFITILSNPFADAGEDDFIFPEEDIIIGGNPSTDNDQNIILWSPELNLSDTTDANPTVIGLMNDQYFFLQVTDANGCVSIDSVLISIIPEIDIPDGFTPNGDNMNETWIIGNVEMYPNIVVEIYNRWGELLFRSEGYNEPWDGRFNGDPLPIGTYYYVIDINEPEFQDKISGPLTILR